MCVCVCVCVCVCGVVWCGVVWCGVCVIATTPTHRDTVVVQVPHHFILNLFVPLQGLVNQHLIGVIQSSLDQ